MAARAAMAAQGAGAGAELLGAVETPGGGGAAAGPAMPMPPIVPVPEGGGSCRRSTPSTAPPGRWRWR
jgi:hypothetical protein